MQKWVQGVETGWDDWLVSAGGGRLAMSMPGEAEGGGRSKKRLAGSKKGIFGGK